MKTGLLKAVAGLAILVCFGAGLEVRAENDYEFAGRLLDIDKESPSFPTQDLVERLIGKLEQSTKKDVKLEGRMIRALLLRKQVANASAERKKELLDEADKIYKEFQKDGQTHALFAESKKAADEIQLEFVKVLIETAKADPNGGADSRKKAIGILDGIKQRQKEEADKAFPALVEAYKDYLKFVEKNAIEADVPAKIMDKIGGAVEKVVTADQHYLQTWLMQIDAYADGDETKKKQAEELGKYCRARVDSEQLSEFGLACAFYLYSKGRAHSYVLDEKNASEAWREALGMLPEGPAEEGSAQTVRHLQRMIIFDLVQMKMKAGEKEPAKYEEVLSLVRQIKISTSLKWILDEPTGKQMLMDYAYALVRQPESSAVEVAEAIKALRDVVASGPPWSYTASQTMAKVLSEAGQKKRPRLNAMEWFDTARGFFYQGQQSYRRYEEQKQGGDAAKAAVEHAEAIGHYEQAVEYYRRAIALARNPEITDAVTRLTVEPSAWFEMGLSYQKMDQLLEAAVAYRALRNAFDKKARERWLPKKYEGKAQEASAKKLLEELDREEGKEEGLLKRSGRNIIIALNKLPPTPPNKRLKETMLEEGGDGLEQFGGDIDYDKGKLALVDAKGFEEQAATQMKNKRPDEAAKNLLQAYQRYKDGVKGFTEVKTSSPLYEVALYQAGSTSVLAQVLLIDKIARTEKMKDEDVAAQSKDLAAKGIKAFQQYEEYVAKTHNPAPEVESRREKLAKLIKLSRTTLFYNAGMMDECIKACDEYLKIHAADLKDTPEDTKLLAVVFNKFRALSKVGGDKVPPECDSSLEEAGKLLNALRVKDTYYRYALGNLSARYFNASVRAEKAQMDVETVRKYDRKLAEYMTKSLKLKPEKERDLDDYGRLLGTLEKIRDYVTAADVAEEMLKLFDPEGKNCRRSDEDWPAILKRMQDVIRFPDLQMMESCRQDHAVLVDYLYEEDRNIDVDAARRPSHDKYPVDFNKAQVQIETIKKNYPKCGTLDPKEGVGGKSWLDIIKEEVDFRQRIVATRQLLADAAIAAAAEVEKKNAEKAAQYRTVADQQLGILLDIIGNVPAMKLKRGELRVANKDYQGALTIFYDVKNGESKNNSSELYVKTSIEISKVYQLMGDGKSAAEYAHFLINTAGIKSRVVEKYWPDIEEFLKWCYANGASPLKEVKVGTTYDYRPKTPDETEFAEVVEPAYKVAAKEGLDKVPPGVRWRYDFLKAKIEHWNEFCVLDRVLQATKGKPNEKEVLTDNFMARYQTLETLHSKENELRKLAKDLDEAIVNLGSFEKVKEKKPELVDKRDKVTTEIAALTKKLKDLPAVELPKLESGTELKPADPQEKKEEGKDGEGKAKDAKADDPKAADPKAGEPKAADPKAGDPKAVEPKAQADKPAETKAAEPKPAAGKQDENK